MKNLSLANYQKHYSINDSQISFGMKFDSAVEQLKSHQNLLDAETLDAFLKLRARTDVYVIDNFLIYPDIKKQKIMHKVQFSIFKENGVSNPRFEKGIRIDPDNLILSYDDIPLDKLKSIVKFLSSKSFLKKAEKIEKRSVKITEEKALKAIEKETKEGFEADKKAQIINSFSYIE